MSITLTAGKNSAITLMRASVYSGEPIIFPTDTIYGIGAPISSISANRRVYEIKRRPQDQPMPLLIGAWEQLEIVAADVSTNVMTWLKNAWHPSSPVRYTAIMKAAPWLDPLYTKDSAVAVRMAALPWLAEAIAELGLPVTATSVNVSGEPPLNTPEEIAARFLPECRYMLWGEPGGGRASTIVDLTCKDTRIIRT